jgi:mutator protein MutT
VLLARRAKSPFKWSFPGGRVEPGETSEDAAIREAREEVSVEIQILAKSGEREVPLPGKRYVISIFAARIVSGEGKTGAEASETGWFHISEIAALDTTEGLAEAAQAAAKLVEAAKA